MAKTDAWTLPDWRAEIRRETAKLPRVDHNGNPITAAPPVSDIGANGIPQLVPPPAADPPADPPPPAAA